MDNGILSEFNLFHKNLHNRVHCLFAGSKGLVSIGPVGYLKMLDFDFKIVSRIFDLEFPRFETRLFSFRNQVNLVLLFDHLAALGLLIGPVSIAFDFVLFQEAA
jgi:hypothetical protein